MRLSHNIITRPHQSFIQFLSDDDGYNQVIGSIGFRTIEELKEILEYVRAIRTDTRSSSGVGSEGS